MAGCIAAPLDLTTEQRQELSALSRAHSTPQKLADPVAQRLAVHPAEPRRRLAAEAIEQHRNGQDARCLPGVPRPLGRRA